MGEREDADEGWGGREDSAGALNEGDPGASEGGSGENGEGDAKEGAVTAYGPGEVGGGFTAMDPWEAARRRVERMRAEGEAGISAPAATWPARNGPHYPPNPRELVIPRPRGMSEEFQAAMMKAQVEDLANSCVVRGVISTLGGGVLGLVFGFAFGGMSEAHADMSQPKSMPLMEEIRTTFRESGKRGVAMAKSFALMGAIFSTTECTVSTIRGRHDLWNGILAGCATGGALAYKAGPSGIAYGCAGFAAFSAAIDVVMGEHA